MRSARARYCVPKCQAKTSTRDVEGVELALGLVVDGGSPVSPIDVGQGGGALRQHEGEGVEGAGSGEIEAHGAWRFAVGDMQTGERRALRIQYQDGPLASLTEMLLDLQEV